jgi:hypothetical protein
MQSFCENIRHFVVCFWSFRMTHTRLFLMITCTLFLIKCIVASQDMYQKTGTYLYYCLSNLFSLMTYMHSLCSHILVFDHLDAFIPQRNTLLSHNVNAFHSAVTLFLSGLYSLSLCSHLLLFSRLHACIHTYMHTYMPTT